MLSALRFHSLLLSLRSGTQDFTGKVRKFLPRFLNPILIHKQPVSYDAYKISTPTINFDPADMLTRNEAIHFLQDSWKMNDVELQLKADREMFLNRLIQTMYAKVPFQLLTASKEISSMLNKQKNAPYTIKKVNEMCMSSLGGGCNVMGTFTWQLLSVLGYSAHLCRVLITSSGTNIHLAVIVKDLVNPGDIHMVDCGFGQPTFRAISLNFNKESPIFQESYLEYKYIKHDGKILRMHGKGDLVKRNHPPIEGVDFIIGKWRRFYEFSLQDFERKALEGLGNHFDVRCVPPHVALRRAAIYPEGKAIILTGNNLFIEEKDKTLKKIKLTTDDEIITAYQDHFPSIDKNLVSLAYSAEPLKDLNELGVEFILQ